MNFLEKSQFLDFKWEVSISPDGSFYCVSFISKEVEISSYSSYASVNDDTVKSNIYILPIEAILIIDGSG